MLHWLSFCDPDKPKGTKFLGACIVEAQDAHGAIMISHILKINLGGEVLIKEIFPAKENINLTEIIPSQYINKLLSKKDIEDFDKFFEKNAKEIFKQGGE